jgi:glycosyltransferase involved in cell wall biosynthesis/ubiquinone/menaquinone biosynthesis C-methylase UbiE
MTHIARGLAVAGAEVRVLTSRYGGLPTREVRDGYTILRAPAIRRKVDRCTPAEMLTFVAGATPMAILMSATWRPDVACAFFGIPGGLVALPLRHVVGVPYLVSLCGGDVPGFMSPELATLHRLARPIILQVWQSSAGLIGCSSRLVVLAQQSWPGAPIENIPNGVDTQEFSPSAGPHPDGPPRLLYVGRLARQKGVIHLLHAMARAKRPSVLRVVGDGPERSRLERVAAELGVDGRVEFVGWSSRAELPSHYRWADAFVLPSLDEGMPNVVLEAQGSGLAILATDLPGTRELVESRRTGLLVPQADSLALAAAIDELVSDRGELRRLGQNARAAALSRGWDRVAGQYLGALTRAARPDSISRTNAFYDAYWPANVPDLPKTRTHVRRVLGSSRYRRALDAGCGSGVCSIALSEFAGEVVALDLSHNSLRTAERLAREAGRPVVHTQRGSVLALPYADASFDLVWSWGVIDHTPEPVRALDELTRVLAQHGTLVLAVYLKTPFTIVHEAIRHACLRLPSSREWVVDGFAALVRLRERFGHTVNVRDDNPRIESQVEDWFFVPEKHFFSIPQMRRHFEERGLTFELVYPRTGRFKSSSNFVARGIRH